MGVFSFLHCSFSPLLGVLEHKHTLALLFSVFLLNFSSSFLAVVSFVVLCM